jgi:hypothetical protein
MASSAISCKTRQPAERGSPQLDRPSGEDSRKQTGTASLGAGDVAYKLHPSLPLTSKIQSREITTVPS